MYFSKDDLHFTRAVCAGYIRTPEYIRVADKTFRCETENGIPCHLEKVLGPVGLKGLLSSPLVVGSLMPTGTNFRDLVKELAEVLEKLVVNEDDDDAGWVVTQDPNQRPFSIHIGDTLARVIHGVPDEGFEVELYRYTPIATVDKKDSVVIGASIFANELQCLGLCIEDYYKGDWYKWKAFDEAILQTTFGADVLKNVRAQLKAAFENGEDFQSVIGCKVPHQEQLVWLYQGDGPQVLVMGNNIPAGTEIYHFDLCPQGMIRMTVFHVMFIGKQAVNDGELICTPTGVEWHERSNSHMKFPSGYRTGCYRNWDFRILGGNAEVYMMCKAQLEKTATAASIELLCSMSGVGFERDAHHYLIDAWNKVKTSKDYCCVFVPLQGDLKYGRKSYHVETDPSGKLRYGRVFMRAMLEDAALFLEHKNGQYRMALIGVRKSNEVLHGDFRNVVGGL